jgi:hypothetical protein
MVESTLLLPDPHCSLKGEEDRMGLTGWGKTHSWVGPGFTGCVRTQPARIEEAGKSFGFHERKGTASSVP